MGFLDRVSKGIRAGFSTIGVAGALFGTYCLQHKIYAWDANHFVSNFYISSNSGRLGDDMDKLVMGQIYYSKLDDVFPFADFLVRGEMDGALVEVERIASEPIAPEDLAEYRSLPINRRI